MLRTALLFDDRYLGHVNPPEVPETPARLEALRPIVENPGRDGIVPVQPRRATREDIVAVHSEAHWTRIEETAGREVTVFDWDTFAGPTSFEVALLAAGGVLAVIDAIREGRADNGFALVRPPGHHAKVDRAMGFCLFNNVAVGAAYLGRHGFDRVAIVDWDVHHGNGTQDIFRSRGDVLFLSLHQWPLYPGTGLAEERGEGDGLGATINLPLTTVHDDAEYEQLMRREVAPALRDFAPDFLLVSAGFDTHMRDPLGGMEVTGTGYRALTRVLMDVARECCADRLAMVLEGGYDLEGLRDGVGSVLLALGGEDG